MHAKEGVRVQRSKERTSLFGCKGALNRDQQWKFPIYLQPIEDHKQQHGLLAEMGGRRLL